MGLRLAEGISPLALAARFGFAEDEMIDRRNRESFARMGYLNDTETCLKVTEQGAPVLEALLADLVTDTIIAA